MKMAKASQKEIDDAIKLAQLTESVCHPHRYDMPAFPDTDEQAGREFNEDSFADLYAFYAAVKACSDGLMRVAFGYQVLLDNACDPDADSLEFNATIIAALEAHEQNDASEDAE